MSSYKAFHARSIGDREGFWGEMAGLIDWEKPFSKVLDYGKPPFVKWYVGGETCRLHGDRGAGHAAMSKSQRRLK